MQFIHFIGYYYALITDTSISRPDQAIFLSTGYLRLNSGAIPFPMAPTTLTVLTNVCAGGPYAA